VVKSAWLQLLYVFPFLYLPQESKIISPIFDARKTSNGRLKEVASAIIRKLKHSFVFLRISCTNMSLEMIPQHIITQCVIVFL